MQSNSTSETSTMKPYMRLFIALAISYCVMFAVMFARVDEWNNIFLSLNQVYMAGLMTAPMMIIMLLVMGSMYKNKTLNIALIIVGVLLIGMFWTLLRTQTGVGNQQFLNSMIPHHAAAILVCEEASLTDPRIEELCVEIIEAQEREILEMKELMQAN